MDRHLKWELLLLELLLRCNRASVSLASAHAGSPLENCLLQPNWHREKVIMQSRFPHVLGGSDIIVAKLSAESLLEHRPFTSNHTYCRTLILNKYFAAD